MADPIAVTSRVIIDNSSYGNGVAVTKSDATVYTPSLQALFIGGAGSVAIVTPQGVALTFAAVPAGTTLPVKASQVLATGTSATSIVGLL